MNLSPQWVLAFKKGEIEAVHWSSVGNPKAPDREIMEFACSEGYVVFTHDLDFGSILASTNSSLPSVIQVRTEDVHPDNLSAKVLKAIGDFDEFLKKGAIVTVDENRAKVRILPLT